MKLLGLEMRGFADQKNCKVLSRLLIRCTVSCIFVFVAQFALSAVPRFFPASSLLTHLALSVLVLLAVVGFGRCIKRLLGVRASAPALVFFNVLFIWGVYMAVVRQAISPLMDIIFNGELVLLIIGLCSILSSDPGLVSQGSSCFDGLVESPVTEVEANYESSDSLRRVRYCRSCNAHIKGFDHHCPAFGNCIGQKNYVLFMVLLVGFVITEASYIACSSQFITEFRILDKTGWEETSLSGNLVVSTMIFSLLQVLWQGVFLGWHVYCVCFNIKTDEWINWTKYPEFQLPVQPQTGQSFTEMRFRNPYDKGVLCNVKEFLVPKE
ncbi:hypothetical protein L1049_013858 [Liquidambar formosana]|uniref:S-acyltransferase n=1 Tax=Liquidambar formosana TaxID=63359 RepID=A0AAP0RQV4_LIQFO